MHNKHHQDFDLSHWIDKHKFLSIGLILIFLFLFFSVTAPKAQQETIQAPSTTPTPTDAPTATQTPTLTPTLPPQQIYRPVITPTQLPDQPTIQPTQESVQNAVLPQDGATALCNDGTYSYSQNHDGTCSHHQGVKEF